LGVTWGATKGEMGFTRCDITYCYSDFGHFSELTVINCLTTKLTRLFLV